MKLRAALLALLVGLSTAAASSCGKQESSSKENTSSKQEATPMPKPLTSLNKENSQLPPGHPPVNKELPPGHPPVNGKMGMPPGHPQVDKELMSMHTSKNMTKFDRPIRIPEEVTKTWKTATVDIVDKASGKVVKEFKVHNGETVKYGGLEIKVLYIVPHLVLDNGYTSGSNEPQNPAILVEVKENGKTIYAGPIYQKFPAMYNINHPRYVLILKGISKEG